jgi:glycerophosphoryl diester phosphodiesterase
MLSARTTRQSLLTRLVWPLLVFEAGIALALLLVLDPLLVALLQALVALSGDPFTGNAALIGFFLSPVGLLTVVTAAVAAIFLVAIEFGGVSLIACDAFQGRSPNLPSVWRRLLPRLPALLGLSAIVFLAIVALLLPVILVALAAHDLFLSDADIYFYLTVRPPAFLRAAGVVGVAAVSAALAAFWLTLRWWLSVPICVLQPVSAIEALRRSAHAAQGRKRALALMLVGWGLGTVLVGALAAAALAGLGDLMLSPQRSLQALTRGVVVFAVVNSAAVAVVSCLSRAALAVLATRFHVREGGPATQAAPLPPPVQLHRLARRAAVVALCVAVPVVSIGQAVWAIGQFSADKPVMVTAHRAGSARAPENTLAALEQAIRDGADDVEIDAQETMDGEVVVLHDTDLRRVTGVARSIWQVRYDEIRDLDAGSWFDPRFHDERIPTLRAFAAAARGRIGLNVELKDNGHGVDLAGRVVAVLKAAGVADRAVVSSLDTGILRQVRQIDPAIPVGFILATGIGNLTGLDVDFFAIARRLATPGLIRRLSGTGHGVHVWGVDNADAMIAAMLDGADTLITDDPALAIEARRWLRELTPPEQALLRLRSALDRGQMLVRPARWHASPD